MKLAIIAAALFVAAPAFAADYPPGTNPDAAAIPQDNPNVDGQTAAADSARQNFYQDKLDAAKAQSQVDSAKADRDAAQDRASQDKADENAAKGLAQ